MLVQFIECICIHGLAAQWTSVMLHLMPFLETMIVEVMATVGLDGRKVPERVKAYAAIFISFRITGAFVCVYVCVYTGSDTDYRRFCVCICVCTHGYI
jgi:hypothetical protein